MLRSERCAVLSAACPRPRPLSRAARALAALAVAVALGPTTARVSAAPPTPRVLEVPSRPAFVRPAGGQETPARPGQLLGPNVLLRTAKPGRLQVQLANGRQFRLGGDAVLRIGAGALTLEKGQIIAWVNPGQKGGSPLKIRTRVATASIMGTTVFIEAGDDSLRIFSWEGHVRVETDTGRRYDLSSGQQLLFEAQAWKPPRRLSQEEAAARRQKSLLLNGFTTPMETLPVIERELGLTPPPASPAPAPR